MAEEEEHIKGPSPSDLPESAHSKASQIARALSTSNAATKALEAASNLSGASKIADQLSVDQASASNVHKVARALLTADPIMRALETASSYHSPTELTQKSPLTPTSLENLPVSLSPPKGGLFGLAPETKDVSINSTSDLGSLIRSARRRMGLSQQSFADLAGVGRRFISELENGKSSVEFDKVLKAAKAAGVGLVAKAGR